MPMENVKARLPWHAPRFSPRSPERPVLEEIHVPAQSAADWPMLSPELASGVGPNARKWAESQQRSISVKCDGPRRSCTLASHWSQKISTLNYLVLMLQIARAAATACLGHRCCEKWQRCGGKSDTMEQLAREGRLSRDI